MRSEWMLCDGYKYGVGVICLYSVLTKSMSGPEKWEKIKGIFYV